MAERFLALLTERGVCVMIIDTLRTKEEQIENIKKGVSWTLNSRHLTGDAIDIVPYSQYQLHGADKLQWDALDPIWLKIGEVGESVGFKWGGRWKQKDMGHFEYPT